MSDSKKKKKRKKMMECSICHEKILKKPGKSARAYAIRDVKPIICNYCAADIAEDLEEAEDYRMSIAADTTTNAKPDVSQKKNSSKKSEKETKKSPQPPKLKLSQIINDTTQVIKGQDNQVKKLATAIYDNMSEEDGEFKNTIIITGDTGSGKTKTLKTMAKKFNVPFVIEDANRYTEAGYVGENVEEMLVNLYNTAGKNLQLAQKGILIIDEGDKKRKAENSGRDVSGENVLFALLKMVEGTVVPIKNHWGDLLYNFDTTNLTIVLSGAFPGLAEIRKKRLGTGNRMGFTSNNSDSNKVYQPTEYTAEDFLKFGFPNEFVGRFDTVIEMNQLTVENYVDIILHSSESALKYYERKLSKCNIKLELKEGTVEMIAKVAHSYNTGARAISRVIKNMFQEISYEIRDDKKKFSTCIIGPETVEDYTKYELVA